MSAIEIRPYEASDLPAIERMSAEIVRDGTVFPFEDAEGVLGYWFGPANEVFVAVDGEDVVGSYVIKPIQPGRGSHVCNAGYMVAERCRGRGVGRLLGEHSLDEARARGYHAMQYNQVVATNESAAHLWRSIGFRVVAELPGAFRHPELGFVDTYVMFREL